MPTVFRHGPYRFYFYSHEQGFRARELAELERIVHDNEKGIVEAWHEYFGT
jgi:hypothetical protein